jgi:hypothetical protein
MKPTKDVLEKALSILNSPFTIELIQFGFTPLNKNQFGISLVNVRSNSKIVLDYYFTIKTGKLVKCETVETIPIQNI